MSSELERDLERALAGAPGPNADATERAERAALDALPSPGELRRLHRRRATLLVAACLTAFVFGGVTLAATGGHLPVVNPEPASKQLRTQASATAPDYTLLPADAVIAAASDGRVTIVTHTGERTVSHRRFSAFALSPGGLYFVEGRRMQVQAIEARTGRVAWARRGIGGRPVSLVWAPFPIRIAYVLHTASGYEVRDMWGTGTHDFVVDRDAADVPPAWRWDSKAFAYVRADGRVAVHDVIGGPTHPLPPACGISRPAAIAFAPAGGLLAVADRAGRISLVDTAARRAPRCLTGIRGRPSLAWLGPTQLLVAARRTLARYALTDSGIRSRTISTRLPVSALDTSPDGRSIVIALRGHTSTLVMATSPPRFSSTAATLAPGPTLLHLHGPVQLEWR